jgi:hypothetical protein
LPDPSLLSARCSSIDLWSTLWWRKSNSYHFRDL